MKPLRGLYVITDTDLMQGRLLTAVEAALKGGATVLQYRDKSGDHRRRRSEAQSLQVLCRQYGIPLLINDDVDLAAEIHADGVHLGRSDATVQEARRLLGPDAIIGATCHGSLECAAEASRQGASYLAFGTVHPSPTKPGATHVALSILAEARRFGLPVVAIGGISADNAAPIIAAGADCVAVISDLWQAPDIAARARAFAQLF